VTSSIFPTPFDEMITLVEENKDVKPFRGVRLVKFKDVDDIRRQLTNVAGPSSTLNPSAAPFIPGQATLPANSAEPSVETTTDEAKEDDDIQDAEDEEDADSPEETDVAAIVETIGTSFTNISAEVLAEQHAAAKTLQSYYRRLLINRANRISKSGLGLTKTRKNQFEAFGQAAGSIEWPQRSLYRPVFLGALPHLLTCLDYTWTIVKEEKSKVKRQESQSAGHQGIEKLMERRTTLWYVNNLGWI
jgi:hypothetical protein